MTLALALVAALGGMSGQAHARKPAIADASPASMLATSSPQVKPGETFYVEVIGESTASASNESCDSSSPLPAVIELPGGQRLSMKLESAHSPHCGRLRYVGTWPAEAIGFVTLSLVDHPHMRLIFEASASGARRPASAVAAERAGREPDTFGDLISARENLPAVEPVALGFHEPMYFVAGGDQPRAARYQISFRYRLFDDRGVVAENLPFVRGLYFGFTQTSLWDLASDSKPFRDTSFRPSLFYQWKLSNPVLGDSLAVATGYEHESNGRDGADSRSIDTLFVRADLRYHLPDGQTYLGIEPKVLTYLDKEDNPDIDHYRGYGQLGLRFGRDDSWLLTALLRRGTAGVGSTQLDLSYPLRLSIFSGVGTFAHLQYFNGYGQTLLEYAESRRPQFRVGVSVVR
jgi:outer membrane phospholipase A